MADGDDKNPKFSKRAAPAGTVDDGKPTLHVTLDPLQSIYIYADELKDKAGKIIKGKLGGSVTFVTESGVKRPVALLYTLFPPGTYLIEHPVADSAGRIKPLFAPNVPQSVIDSLNDPSKQGMSLLRWAETDEDHKVISNMLARSVGKNLRVVVSYSRATGGNVQNVGDNLPLTGTPVDPLSDPKLALMYLQFMQHFGGVDPDFNLAEDGLTRDEIDTVEQNKPELIAITDLFLQGFSEFSAAKKNATPAPGLDEFQAMEEAIFFQKKVKNSLALRNMLEIAIGTLIFTTENGDRGFKDDIGVRRRSVTGSDRLLLYDRFGNAVRSIVSGFVDTEFRSTDLEKVNRDLNIPFLDIHVSDRALYLFLRNLEQELGHPVREIEALVASYYKYHLFITAEITRRYNGEIGKRLLAMAPFVVGFFVAHAFVAALLRAQPVAGVALMLLLKGAGAVLGFNQLLLDTSLLAQAGRHFTQMEQLHRESGDKTPQLTKLSEGHLKAGAAALLDAMADFIALGVLVVGSFAASKFGPALVRGLKNAAAPKSKLTIENDTITKIEPTDPMKDVKTPKVKADVKSSSIEPAKQPEGTDAKPVEQPDAYKGEQVLGKQPASPDFKLNRPKALDQSAQEFAADKPAQSELFQRAGEAVARQNKFIRKILADLDLNPDFGRSIPKRKTLADFAQKIIDKVGGRKGYPTVGGMTDMIRGRVNVEDPADAERVYQAILAQIESRPLKWQRPRAVADVPNGYPRFHIDVEDPETGITHEWQIGTQQVTDFYETPGIDPAGVHIEPGNTNIHDIEYDIFKSIDEPNKDLPADQQQALRELAAQLNLHPFRQKVAQFAARLGGETVPAAELATTIKAVHAEASALLRELVRLKGTAFVESFLH